MATPPPLPVPCMRQPSQSGGRGNTDPRVLGFADQNVLAFLCMLGDPEVSSIPADEALWPRIQWTLFCQSAKY